MTRDCTSGHDWRRTREASRGGHTAHQCARCNATCIREGSKIVVYTAATAEVAR